MYDEIQLGATYIVGLLNRSQKLSSDEVERFTTMLVSILCDRFVGHWYPDCPEKGQAYRCIQIEYSSVVDDSVLQACVQSGLRCSQLYFPKHLSVWIDPEEVSCRIGESCHPFIVKPPEDPKKTTSEEAEEDTSDYCSEASDLSLSPSGGSSDEEDNVKSKKKVSLLSTQKMGAQYYYNPAPTSSLFYPFPGPAMGYLPPYPPMTFYYMVPKYNHNVKPQKWGKKWKPKKASIVTVA
ncbi:maternal B9.10 protein-like isoform 1-T2 [Leptodactylus fuscus]|uniref:maternal B9.10 protein-like n=1 Tax=Leptodactylus fuscus TaxID=238119 RepID=UPI003F4E8392